MADNFTEWKPPEGGGQIPDAWLSQMYAYLQQHPLPVPLSQVTGYQRAVAGYIGSGGTDLSQNGQFTVNHTGAGAYTVTFTRKFGKQPGVVVTTNELGNARFIIAGNISTTGFDVEIYNPAGVLTNTDFSFFAQGS